jgi:hypothetical protein
MAQRLVIAVRIDLGTGPDACPVPIPGGLIPYSSFGLIAFISYAI